MEILPDSPDRCELLILTLSIVPPPGASFASCGEALFPARNYCPVAKKTSGTKGWSGEIQTGRRERVGGGLHRVHVPVVESQHDAPRR